MTKNIVYLAIDIAKKRNDVLVEQPSGVRKKFKILNNLDDYETFYQYLTSFKCSVQIGLEATGNYHRPLAYYLLNKGFEVRLISSIALSRTREAMHNSWDKNDPKDCQVMLHLLKTRVTQTYHDTFLNGGQDLDELSKTHYQVSLRKVRIQHSLLTHYLPLYFPEADKYFHSSRAAWFSKMLYAFPCPQKICSMKEDEFIEKAWSLAGRKVAKRVFLSDFYHTASRSIGLPVDENSHAIKMFRLTLLEHHELCRKRQELENLAHDNLKNNTDYQRLRSVPGIGPILALTILAETGNFRRFKHHRQYLKFCGIDLCTQQSGQFRGSTKLSKRGNSRLRCAYWMAATIAVRMRENTFQKKYSRYIRSNPKDSNLKRKALVATSAKIARVCYSLVKNQKDYRPYYDNSIPSGVIRSDGPLRQ